MFRLFNRIVIFIHTKIFTKYLERALRTQSSTNFSSLELRNSILTAEYFHFLYSDIDLAVVLKSCEFPELTKVRKILVRYKRFYPPMGEVEIYSVEEWERLLQLKREVESLYVPARSIRKYFWMGAPDDDYQGPKRLRALRVILRKLRINGEAPYSKHVIDKLVSLTRNFVSEETVEGENSFYHTYFTCPILAPMDYTNSGFKLSAFELVALASLFPTDDAGYFSNKNAIDQIHQRQPKVQNIWNALKAIDRLELEGSKRGRI
jgi:hypothetical protein